MRIAKIPAARALGEVAAERGEMADLRRGETECRGRDARIGRREARVGGDRGDGGEGADAWLRRRRPSSRRSCRARPQDRSAVPVETPLRRRSERSVPAARNSAVRGGHGCGVMLRPSLSMRQSGGRAGSEFPSA